MKKKWYLQTWFIALLFALWPIVVPTAVGLVLLIMQYIFERKRNEAYKSIDDADEYKAKALKQAEETANQAEIELKKAQLHAEQIQSEAEQERESINAQIVSLKQELSELDNEITAVLTSISVDESITSEEYRSKYNLLLLEEKEAVKSGIAIKTFPTAKPDAKALKNDERQLLRSFNSEVEAALKSITVKNIQTVKNKIVRAFETLNKLYTTDYVELTQEFLQIKLKEADLLYSFEYQKEQERLQQKEIREQMVEEEKVRREIEKEKAKIEKEERQFQNEINKLMTYMRQASEIEKQLYVDKIKELEDKLSLVEKDKANVLDREQHTRAGFVYVISNIGSFGENVYKIGMTRRLEPMDRIDELSSASVPFAFDVHAMIFSEDAPSLETTLHNYFDNRRVNKVNPRKEFFRVGLDEIEEVVTQNFNGTVTFTKTAEAYQYRESLRLAGETV